MSLNLKQNKGQLESRATIRELHANYIKSISTVVYLDIT